MSDKEKNKKAFIEAVSDCLCPNQELTGNNIFALVIVALRTVTLNGEEDLDKIDLDEAGKIVGQISQQKVGGEMWERLFEMFHEHRKEYNRERREWNKEWRENSTLEEEKIADIKETTRKMKEKKDQGDEEAYVHFKMELWGKVLREVFRGNLEYKQLAHDAIEETGIGFYEDRTNNKHMGG
jgi:hypothetical protein